MVEFVDVAALGQLECVCGCVCVGGGGWGEGLVCMSPPGSKMSSEWSQFVAALNPAHVLALYSVTIELSRL